MTDVFSIVDGELLLTYGGRRVIDTAGSLVLGLPDENDYSGTVDIAFPDVTKGWLYNWRWESLYQSGSSGEAYSCGNIGDAYITAIPAEWSDTTIVAAVPKGCNLVAAKVRLNRTLDPSHAWNSHPLTVWPPTNVWIPFTGSALLEHVPGFARAMSLIIEKDDPDDPDSSLSLVLHQQQSVGAAPGFTVVDSGHQTMAYGATGTADGANALGGEWAYSLSPGLGQVVYFDATMHGVTTGTITLATPGAPPFSTSNALGDRRRPSASPSEQGINALPVTDPTDYASVYAVEIVAKFCKATL